MRGNWSLILLAVLAVSACGPTPKEARLKLIEAIEASAEALPSEKRERLGCLIGVFKSSNVSAALAEYRRRTAQTAYPEDADFVAWHIGFRAGETGGALAEAACSQGGER